MTTVAWDGTTLAADRMGVCGGTKRPVYKLFDCGEYWYAGTGIFEEVHHAAEWLRAGADPAEPIETDEAGVLGLVVRKANLAAFLLEGKKPVLVPVRRVPWATGSGHEYAVAALNLGKNAVEAIRFASRFDVYTGLGVDSVRLRRGDAPGPKKRRR